MALSKARNAARMRNKRALERGVQPSATQLVEVMSTNQRKERLAELIATPIKPEEVKPIHIISAIDVYNKMDHTYTETPVGEAPVIVNSFTFILPDGTKVTPKQMSGYREDAIEGTGQDLAQTEA